MRTQNIPTAVVRDAMSIAGGLYSMNVKGASGYAFCVHRNNKEVCYGEFVWKTMSFDRERLNHDHFDGYIDYKDKTLEDFESGQVISLA